MNNGIEVSDTGTVIATGTGVQIFQALAIKQGLKAIQIGMRVNRAYTPTACMMMATKITGKKFKSRDYQAAIDALEEWTEARR